MEYDYKKLFATADTFSDISGEHMNLKSIEYADDYGNTYKLLFNSNSNTSEAPMPEIETGDVLQTYNLGPNVIGVVVGDNVFWQDGRNANLQQLIERDGIGQIWRGLKNFEDALDKIPIWRRKDD